MRVQSDRDGGANLLYLTLDFAVLEAPAPDVALTSVQGRKRGRLEGSWTMG